VTQVVELPPRTGLEMPDADQLQRLRSYVVAEHPWLRDTPEAEFPRGFWVAGTFHRRPTPDGSVYYVHWVSIANQRLERAGLAPIGGQSFLCACLAHADIVWQKPDPGVGALLELGLSEFSGQSCSNTWRGLLAGERGLLKPVLRDRGIARQDGIRVVRSVSE
jgi:hypothetical protein